MAGRLMRNETFKEAVGFTEVTADGAIARSPKHVVRHIAAIDVLIIPAKE